MAARTFSNKMKRSAKLNGQQTFRSKLDELWLRAVRGYTYHTPISRGRDRLYMAALMLCRQLPAATPVPTKDGRLLSADLKTGMQTTLYFLGEYEKAITDIVVSILGSGKNKVFIDAGANFGWYTTIFRKYAGSEGSVHSFEPVPATFANLERNYELMGSPANVRINNLALGDEEKEITINLFDGLPSGHASISDQHRDDAVPVKAKMVTLDSYLQENRVGNVDFVKVDIEGAEMMFLKGADKLFNQAVPPIWLMEMALNQTKNFGYLPEELIQFMRSRAGYDFYKIDEVNCKLIPIEGFDDDDIGANVVCIPKNAHPAILASVKPFV